MFKKKQRIRQPDKGRRGGGGSKESKEDKGRRGWGARKEEMEKGRSKETPNVTPPQTNAAAMPVHYQRELSHSQ